MKKVLGLFLLATDLFAAAITPESTGLTPKTLARDKTITQEQVAQYVRNAIDAVSRVPNEMEQEATSKLAAAFEATMSASDSIDEIRVFDTASFINGCYLNRTRKDELLSLSCEKNEENIEELCDLLCKNIRFEDEALKKQILDYVREGCESSPVFYRQIISYIARLEDFSHPFDRGCTEENLRNEIIRSDYSYSKYRKIGLQLDDEYGYSYFKLPGAQNLPSSLFAMKIPPKSCFFHEVGHTVDTVTLALSIYHLDQTIDMLAPSFLDANPLILTGFPLIEALKNKSIFHSDEFDKWLTQYKNIQIQLQTLQQFQIILGTGLQSKEMLSTFSVQIKDSIELLKKASRELETILKLPITTNIAKINVADVWQMFGVLLLPREDNKKVLYINKNSDIAFYVSVGLPFRATHVGSNKVALFSDAFPHLPCKMPSIYKPLVEALTDTTWGGYITRLIYPNGLLSGLQREYDLQCEHDLSEESPKSGIRLLTDGSQGKYNSYAPSAKKPRSE